MGLLIIYSFLPVFFFCIGNAALPPEIELAINRVIEETVLPLNNAPGLSLAIVNNIGDVVYTRGFGYKNIHTKQSVDENTLFAIASISKSFTATVVINVLHSMFPDVGESVLDFPIISFNPKLNLTFIDKYRSEYLSFRDLLSHRTCLSPTYLGRDVGGYGSMEELVYRIRYQKEVCPLRTDFVYNNGVYALAGEIIGRVANSSYRELVVDLLSKIDMNNTILMDWELNFDNMSNMSRGYYERYGQLEEMNWELLKRTTVSVPSGGILTSAVDMAKYMRFHLNKGKVGNVQIVPENVMKWMYKPTFVFGDFDGYKKEWSDAVNGDIAYGLAYDISLLDGWSLLQHSGYWPPYNSRMSLFPGTDYGIFSSTNGPGRLRTIANHRWLHEQIFYILEGKTPPARITEFAMETLGVKDSRSRNKKQKRSRQTASQLPPTPKRLDPTEIVGTFGHPVQGDFTIKLVNDSAWVLEYGIWGKAELREMLDSRFQMKFTSDIVADIYCDYENEVPPGYLIFIDVDTIMFDDGYWYDPIEFKRNATLDTYPEIPWDTAIFMMKEK